MDKNYNERKLIDKVVYEIITSLSSSSDQYYSIVLQSSSGLSVLERTAYTFEDKVNSLKKGTKMHIMDREFEFNGFKYVPMIMRVREGDSIESLEKCVKRWRGNIHKILAVVIDDKKMLHAKTGHYFVDVDWLLANCI